MMVGDRGEPIIGQAVLQESHSVEYPNDFCILAILNGVALNMGVHIPFFPIYFY